MQELQGQALVFSHAHEMDVKPEQFAGNQGIIIPTPNPIPKRIKKGASLFYIYPL